MKKFVAVACVAAIVLTLCFALTACGGTGNVSYGKKYINSYDVRAEEKSQEYYVINSDGTAEYHAYSQYVGEYVVTYKYSWVDDSTIILAYHSVTYQFPEQATGSRTGETLTLTVSKNAIITEKSDVFFNQDYVEKELTNFGK